MVLVTFAKTKVTGPPGPVPATISRETAKKREQSAATFQTPYRLQLYPHQPHTEAMATKPIRLSTAVIWIAGFVLLAITPLLSLLIDELPPQTSFGWDFAAGLGFAAAMLLLLMSLLIARFRRLSAPFGIDAIYYFHRQVALLMLVLVLAHVLILFWVEPLLVYLFRWPGDPVVLTGSGATLTIVALVVTALARKRLHIAYESWRRFHAAAAIVAVLLCLGHLWSVSYYTGTKLQTGLWTALAVAWLLLTLYVRLLKPLRQMARPYAVSDVRAQQGNSWSLTVEPVGHPGLNFKPGQFAWISSRHSPFALSEHPFSFSSSAEARPQLEFTIKQLGDYSSTIKDLKPGETVYVDGPYGLFTIDQYDAPGFAFIAGGIGIAPVISMLRTLADRRDRRPLTLIFANCSADSIIYKDELDQLVQVLNLKLVHVLTEAPTDWQCEIGMINHDVLCRYLSPMQRQWHYFVCGPVPMMKVVERCLHQQGIAYSHIHSEIFNLI